MFTGRVLTAVISLKEDFIRWSTEHERERMSDYMDERYGLKNAVGIIDGTHFNLSQRPHVDGEVFWTRKCRYGVHGTVYFVCLILVDCL